MRSEAYLKEIRQSPGLRRAVLNKIVVEGKRVVFHLFTDLSYSPEDIAYAESVSARYVPSGYEAAVGIMKSVPSVEGVRAAITQFLKKSFPAAAAFISPEDVTVELDPAGGRYRLAVGEDERAQFSYGDVLDSLGAELCRRFCGVWTGEYVKKERTPSEIEREVPPEEYVLAPRTFPICDYSPIDGAAPTTALYIADLAGEQQNITLCGTVTYIEERLTRKEKPFFMITISDGSGQLRASYFTKVATLEKVRAIKVGDHLCLTGNRELFGGNFRFTARHLDYGAPPAGFVPVSRPSRPVPARYLSVFPEAMSDLVQADLFGGKALPEEFCKGKFVVFDLETTGLNSSPVGGSMDRIIEIGAVKVEGGQICEKFSTFVSCPVRLSAEIVKLTGIEDDMLVGAPEVKEAIADFFKFCEGSVLVAHNAPFDCGFIRYYGEQEGYVFDQRTIDTVAFAQRVLRLGNYKLNTIADHYGFVFHHHRAFDDAFVTAKIFIELVRESGGLPK